MKGFHIRTPESLELISKPFLDEVWEYNARDPLAWDIGTTGAVTGDVFLMVTFEEPSLMQRRINPFSQGQIRVNLLGSEQVYPTWDPLNTDTLIAARIETIYYAERGTRQLDREDRVNHEGRQLYTKRFTQIITRDQIVEQYHGDMPLVRPNVLGEIPLVHIRNLGLPKEYYGLPDGADLIDLQREFNEKATDISDVINYHCLDAETEALTCNGWKKFDQLSVVDKLLTLDPETDEIRWETPSKVNVYDYDGELVQWDNRTDALTTPNHRWLVERRIGRPENRQYVRQFARTATGEVDEPPVEAVYGARVILGGGTPTHFPGTSTYSDELVETIGWLVTEGCVSYTSAGSPFIVLAQSETANPSKVRDFRRLHAYWASKGKVYNEDAVRPNGVVTWRVGKELTEELLVIAPNKSLTPEFLMSLTHAQARLLYEILVDGDGTWVGTGAYWYQDDGGRVGAFQMLLAMLEGGRTAHTWNNRGNGVVYVHKARTIEAAATVKRARSVRYKGKVWCPTVSTGVWFARRGGYTYWTGNSAPVTVITGAKAKQLERGPRQIWSGLPEKASVFNLKLEGDLTAAQNYLQLVKQCIHELSDTPEGSLGKEQAISNTSGVALHIQYQPLIEKTRRKKAQYEPGFEQVNYFMLRIGMVKGLINLPFDLCKHCGGRIIEIETGQKTLIWSPDEQKYIEAPIRKKRCYHIDKQTMEFTDPYDMRMKYWRQHGFGPELRDMTLKQIIDEIEKQRRSFWDYTVIQEAQLEKWRQANASAMQAAHTAQVENLTPPTPPPQPGGGDEGAPNPSAPEQPAHLPPVPQALIPQVLATPPKIQEPPMLRIQHLPIGEVDLPEEPEHVTVSRSYLNPDTGVIAHTVTEEKFLVPTDCKRPAYLNPFETKVEFNDVLPKDEALQAQLYAQYQTNGWVDAEWVQEKIPEIAVAKTEINKRMKAQKAVREQLPPTQQVATTTQGSNVAQTTYGGEAAPGQPSLTAIPGPGGNPMEQQQQLQPGGGGP